MKSMNLMIATVMVLGSSFAFAGKKPSKAELYAAFCGSKSDIEKVAGKVSDEELQDLADRRTSIFDVLAGGADAVNALSQEENGVINVLLVCGVLDEISAQVAKKGCTDLNSGDVVRDNGGLAACNQAMKQIKNRQ